MMSEPVRILIVEDLPTDFDLAQREIRKAVNDCVFQNVQTRPDFLEALDAFQPDLILSDYHLPTFDGMTALKLAQERAPLIPLIIWTGTLSEDTAAECMKAGADNYILKENIKRLGPAVVHALEERRLLLERKRTEERLRDSEKRFRALIENSSEEISLLAPDGTLLYESPSTHPTLGYESGQFLRQDMFQLVHSEDLERMHSLFARLVQTPGLSLRDQFRLRHNSGEWRWVEAVGTNLLAEPAVQAIVVNYHDITERKRAEMERQALLDIRQGLITTKDLQEFLKLIHHSIGKVIYAENFFVVFYNKETGLFEEVYSVDKYDPPASPSRLEKSITSYVFRTGEPVLLTHAMFDELAARGEVELVGTNSESWLGAPLKTPGGTIGVIAVQDYERTDRYTERDKELLASIAGQVSLALERKQAEQALREAEAKYRSLVEQLPAITYIVNFGQGNDASYISPQIESLLGFSQEEWVSNPNLWVQQLHPDDRQQVMAEFELRDSLGQPINIDYRLLSRDGHIRWFHDQSVLIPDSNGQPHYAHGLLFDITERKNSEEALRDAESKYRTLVEQIPAITYIATLDEFSRATYVSPQINALGFTPEEWIAGRWAQQLHPDDRERVLVTVHQSQAASEPFNAEYRLVARDGQVRWYRDEALVVRDAQGQPRYLQGVMLDITGSKQAEKEITRNVVELEALYENGLAVGRLLNSREIGERIIETFSRYLSWHHVTIRLRRRESDDLELVAFNLPGLDENASAEAEQTFIDRISRVGQGMSGWVVHTGLPIRTGDVQSDPQYVDTFEGMQSGLYMPMKVGDLVIGCISVESELPDAFTAQDERLLATLANQAAVAFENAHLYQSVQQELSERRRAEEQLEHERNSLAQRVEQRTVDLSRANIDLARALKVKDEFLANMSHELRTPLNAILGLSESLSEQVAGPLNEKQQKYVATISESGHHLLSLINDILDLAKIEAGQITLDIKKVDMNSICQASLRMIKQLAQKKNQDVTFEIDEGFGLMWADERRLKQMIVNLLSNAVKFTPEDGKIGLEVRGDRDENRVMITVWDNGIGIREGDIPRLSQPFVQLDSGFAREATGTGLGLTLVTKMASMHGGSVSIASDFGKGSRFTIILPWEPALAVDTVERLRRTGKFPAIKPDAKNKPTILLVEDTQEVVLMLKDYLELTGYKIVTAQDGMDGITQAKLTHPDLILMDLQMPRMNGLEATAKLRSDPDFQHTPIIALTALAMSGDRERCLAAGMDEYISKPVNLKALVKIIQGCLPDKDESKSQ